MVILNNYLSKVTKKVVNGKNNKLITLQEYNEVLNILLEMDI